MENFDFGGYATRNDLLCGDGRTIRKDAFKDDDGKTVPLIWNHDHTTPDAVLGHAVLENREDGVYARCKFNDTEAGQNAKTLVHNGDVRSLSIWANKLKHAGRDVIQGTIRELSLVLAGANPGAYIDEVMAHSDDEGLTLEINYDENAITIYDNVSVESDSVMHSDDETDVVEETEETSETDENTDELETSEETEEVVVEDNADDSSDDESEESEESEDSEEETEVNNDSESIEHSEKDDNADTDDIDINKIVEGMTEEQKTVFYGTIASIVDIMSDDKEDETDADEKENKELKHSEGGNETMKKNVFDQNKVEETSVLSHSDQEAIIATAKQTGVGSLQEAIKLFASENESMAHGLDLDDTETLNELLPDHKLLNPGAPEIYGLPDQSWVMGVINKIHKSPYSRVRTRKADARQAELKAKGYKKGEEKKFNDHIKLLGRKTEPTTIYIKEQLHRDDIVDITDFSAVDYIWSMMKGTMFETLALAALVGDGRDDSDPDKISETNIRPIWKDEELYTIHRVVDIAKARAELQGSNTSANFGENYIYAEAMVTAALYSREKFKGSGAPVLYCAPHLVNVMLLARDLNGRRIYDSKADLAKALNVSAIIEIEQFDGLTRVDDDGKTRKLLGLIVNLADYQFGSTQGGEITKFSDFDIDFNKYKYLMETRLSGALTEPESAIALEELVETSAG